MSFRGSIYCISCLFTDKMYIGQTVKSIEYRFATHVRASKNGRKYKLYLAMQKHGYENFTVEEVMWVEAPTQKELKAKLDFLECHFIQRYDTKRNGYNMTDGGDGQLGRKCSEEVKQRLSEKYKGQPSCRKGVKLSEETKMKSSKTWFSKGRTPWNKGKRGVQIAWNKGKRNPNRKTKSYKNKIIN